MRRTRSCIRTVNLKELQQFAGDDVAQDAMDDLALELQEARNALATRERVIKDQQALIESLSRQLDSKEKEIDSMTRELDDQNRLIEKIHELTI